MGNDLKIRMPEWARNMYNRIIALIDASGGGGEENVIESISLNGGNVPPDANKNVALAESDPTVPSWAKQSSKPSYTAAEIGALPTGNYNMSETQIGGLNRIFAGVDITQADNGIPGTIKQGQLLTAMDANSRRFFVIRSIVDGNGDIEFRIGCYNNDGTDTIGVYGYVVISKDGTVTFTFSHPDEIKQALDIIEATTTQAGLMSAADKTKLDGITPGGDVTGVKGNAENAYRQGNVNLTPANIGAVAKSGDTMSGTLTAPAFSGPLTGNVTGHASQDLLLFTAGGIASCDGGGQNWYYKIATIEIANAYIDRPIVFEISGRGFEFSLLQVLFYSSSNLDPGLYSFTTNNNSLFWIKKTATSTWEIYGKYNETYGSACIHRITGMGADIGVTVNMTNAGTSDSIISGATQANIVAVPMSGVSTNNPITGNLYVKKGGDTFVEVTNTNTGARCLLDSDVAYHGIWSNGYWNGSSLVTDGKWMLYRDSNGKIIFNDTLGVDHGGTGATTAAGARANLGAAAASDVRHVYVDTGLIGLPLDTSSYYTSFETVGKNVYINFRGESRTHAENEVFMVIPEGYRSGGDRYFPAAINNTACGVVMRSNGNVSIWSPNPASGRIFLSMSYCIE